MSPILFSLYTECLMRDWYEHPSHLRAPNVSGISIKEIRYADDLVMMALCRADAEEMLAILVDISEGYGLVIQGDLQIQCATVSTRTTHCRLDERGFYGRRPRRTPLEREREKKVGRRYLQIWDNWSSLHKKIGPNYQ